MIEQRTEREHARTERRSLGERIAAGWLRVRMIAVLALLPVALLPVALLPVALLPVALRVLSVVRIVALLTPPRPPREARPELLYPGAWWVDRLVDRRPFRFWGHCMRRSLALYYVATRSGYPAVLALGVRRDGVRKAVIGHGWLELEGVPFLEPGDHPETRFVVMYRLPVARAPSTR